MRMVQGKLALVTGGALGMGREWCKHLADDGARVAIWDINGDAMAQTASELRAKGVEVFTEQVDVYHRHRIYEAADSLRRRCGDIDILINNAGIVTASPAQSGEAVELMPSAF